VRRAGEFRSYWVWEPVLTEVGGREQQLVHVTVERANGEHVLAAYGLSRYIDRQHDTQCMIVIRVTDVGIQHACSCSDPCRSYSQDST